MLDVLHRHTTAAKNKGKEVDAFPIRDFLEVRRIPSLPAIQRVSEFQVKTTSLKWFIAYTSLILVTGALLR